MIDETRVELALRTAGMDFLTANSVIGTTTGLPVITSDNIKVPNERFNLEGRSVWAELNYLPNTPDPRTIGYGGQDELTGIFQIDINTRLGAGTQLTSLWFQKARLYFPPGKSFTNDGHGVEIVRCGANGPRVVDADFRLTLSLTFSSFIKRLNSTI